MLNNLKTYFYILPVKYIDKFKKDKFKHNNFRMLLVSSILIIVELYSALFITIPNTKLQFLTFITAFIMFIYTIISVYFYKVNPIKIRLIHKIYQLSIAFIGITIAII